MRTRDRPVAAGISRFWIYAPAAALLLAIGYASLGPAPAHETPGAALPTSVAPLAGDAAAHLRPPPSSPKLDAALEGHHAALRLAPGPAEMGPASWCDMASAETADGARFGGETVGAGALTAAHGSLPRGTRVLVENIANGQTVVARITGRRLPGADGRIIDLSKAAAEKLDMIKDGTATVRVRRIDDMQARAPGRSDIVQ
jgi:rare lipoprotein A